jgi:hypothetical protein
MPKVCRGNIGYKKGTRRRLFAKIKRKAENPCQGDYYCYREPENMSKTDTQFDKGEIIIYQSSEKEIELKVRLENETVWLTQSQIALLFGTQRPAITKHINNIFKSGELDKDSVSSILEHTATDGKTYKTK